jgi:hypothetical protein
MPRQPVQLEYAHFVFEVSAPKFAYSFSSRLRKHDPEPYWEHPNLELAGKCLYPAKFADRIGKIEIVADRELPKPQQGSWRASGDWIGYLEAGKSKLHYYGSVPPDALGWVLTSIASGMTRFVAVNGEPLKRGTARIRGCSFDADFVREDFY